MMKTRFQVGAVALCGMLAAAVQAKDEVHWGYTGDTGPEHWGNLSEDFASCRVGKNQSPINIETSKIIDAKLQPLEFNYHGETTEIINNGHTLQANVTPGSVLKIEGHEFELKQFHMHSPSENQIDGESFPLELHFVHVSAEGQVAVFSELFREGEAYPTLVDINDIAPKEAGKSAPFVAKLADLLPRTEGALSSYYRYSGSLTTPPCTEGLRWYVLPMVKTVSKEQVQKYVDLIGKDARPTQPLNARKVLHAIP